MNQLLGDFIDVCALVHLDDILIFSHTEKHWKYVCKVFDKLAKFKYYAKNKKYELFYKAQFLGRTVSAAGIGII